jgi:hypothetical protein
MTVIEAVCEYYAGTTPMNTKNGPKFKARFRPIGAVPQGASLDHEGLIAIWLDPDHIHAPYLQEVYKGQVINLAFGGKNWSLMPVDTGNTPPQPNATLVTQNRVVSGGSGGNTWQTRTAEETAVFNAMMEQALDDIEYALGFLRERPVLAELPVGEQEAVAVTAYIHAGRLFKPGMTLKQEREVVDKPTFLALIDQSSIDIVGEVLAAVGALTGLSREEVIAALKKHGFSNITQGEVDNWYTMYQAVEKSL